MILEILAAGFIGDAIHQEIKKAKKTGDISPSAKNVIGDIGIKTGSALGKTLVDVISKSILK